MADLYPRILCPVDFSDVSRSALEWSVDFARRTGRPLSVMHAVDTRYLNVGNLVAVPGSVEEVRARAKRQFDGWRSELGLSNVDFEVSDGVPADAIVAAAHDGDGALVIAGTHGWSGLSKLLLGSVMEKVLHRLRVPMIAVPPRNVGTDAEPSTILVAIDFGPETERVVAHAAFLAELYGARLVAAHVVPVPYVVLNDKTLDRLSDEQMSELMEAITADKSKALAGLVSESGSLDVDIVTKAGAVFPTLHQLIGDREVDLVITGAGDHGTSGLGWVGSTCHKLVRSAPCPVLIVR